MESVSMEAIQEKIKSNEILMKIIGSIGGPHKLIPIVQSGLEMVKSKVPEIGDIIGIGGKLAALVGQFKISGSEKQLVVIEVVDMVLGFLADKVDISKIAELRDLAKNTLPSVLTLAVSAAKGKLDFAGIKNNKAIMDSLKSAAHKFLKMMRPRLLVCGLSTTIIDKAEEITAPPKRVQPAEASPKPVQAKLEEPTPAEASPSPSPQKDEKEPGLLKEAETIPAQSVVYDA